MMILPLAEIIARKVFGTSIRGSTTYVQHMTLIVGMLGGAIAARENRLLRIAILDTILKGRIREITHLTHSFVAAAVTVFLTVAAVQFLSFEREFPKAISYGIEEWMLKVFLPVGFGLVALPLLIAVFWALFNLDRLAEQSEQLVVTGVTAAENNRQLEQQVASLERVARQYLVLGTDDIRALLNQDLQALETTLDRIWPLAEQANATSFARAIRVSARRVVNTLNVPDLATVDTDTAIADFAELRQRVTRLSLTLSNHIELELNEPPCQFVFCYKEQPARVLVEPVTKPRNNIPASIVGAILQMKSINQSVVPVRPNRMNNHSRLLAQR